MMKSETRPASANLGEMIREAWKRAARGASLMACLAAGLGLYAFPASAQTAPQQKPSPAGAAPRAIPLAMPPSTSPGPPLTLSLSDALERAEKNSPQFQAAVTAVNLAHEGQVQASAAMKPQFSYLMQYLNTQGNGISPVGRFVTNDGVHVYRAWGVMHQDMPGSFFIDAGPRRAAYMKAIADAEQDVAQRGLNVTVTQDYYALLVAERNYATAQKSLQDSRRFLQIAEALEKGGEVAHADVIRFQIEVNQKENTLADAKLAMSDAQLNLSVLLFPTFNENFTVVDDLDTPPPIPSFQQAEAMAKNRNPDLRAALAAYNASGVDVAMAKSAFFPSLGIEFDYGIEANALALHSDNLTRPGVIQPNLGYFVTYSLNLPVWDWGTLRSKLHMAEDQKALARVNLSYAQRQILNELYSSYNEAAVAWNELGNLRRSVDLAARNLELVTMQYQAGETQVLQVLDAENSLDQARNADAAGAARYRNALAALQTVTGSF
jgi:outer membrane protein TolC